jgi:alkylation response protein AidB-like acyl-CoA dehydrogenase
VPPDQSELGELAQAVRDLLGKQAKPTLPLADTLAGPDSAWPWLAGELGLAGLLVAADLGGLDLGIAAAAAVAEELGRACYGGPFQSSCVEASVLLGGLAHPLAAELLAEMADGGRLSTVALTPGSVVASGRPYAVRLTGTTPIVLDLERADTLLVVVEVDETPAVVAVDRRDLDAATVSDVPSLDLARRLATVELAATPAILLAQGDSVAAALDRVLVHRGVVVGADAVGVAAQALDLAVDYAKKREQFGRPIGSFQAVKHTLATLHVRLEVARSAVAFAVADGGLRGFHAVLATAPEAAVTITTEALQLHGGIGYTWEYPAHVLLRRARADAALFGTPAYHRRALFQIIEGERRA